MAIPKPTPHSVDQGMVHKLVMNHEELLRQMEQKKATAREMVKIARKMRRAAIAMRLRKTETRIL